MCARDPCVPWWSSARWRVSCPLSLCCSLSLVKPHSSFGRTERHFVPPLSCCWRWAVSTSGDAFSWRLGTRVFHHLGETPLVEFSGHIVTLVNHLWNHQPVLPGRWEGPIDASLTPVLSPAGCGPLVVSTYLSWWLMIEIWRPGWHQNLNSPDSASQVLELQLCITIPGLSHLFMCLLASSYLLWSNIYSNICSF
jgi:hypothetical protein